MSGCRCFVCAGLFVIYHEWHPKRLRYKGTAEQLGRYDRPGYRRHLKRRLARLRRHEGRRLLAEARTTTRQYLRGYSD